jgi:uncharacterized cupin superfamily protein
MTALTISVHANALPARGGSDCTAPHHSPCREWNRRTLGDAFGLSQLGVNFLELAPGIWSSQRHCHERKEKLVEADGWGYFTADGRPTK